MMKCSDLKSAFSELCKSCTNFTLVYELHIRTPDIQCHLWKMMSFHNGVNCFLLKIMRHI